MLLRLELACLFCVAKGLIDKQTTYTCTWHSYTRSVFSNHPPLPLLHSPSTSTPICLFWLKDNFSVPVTDVISKLLPPMRLVSVSFIETINSCLIMLECWFHFCSGRFYSIPRCATTPTDYFYEYLILMNGEPVTLHVGQPARGKLCFIGFAQYLLRSILCTGRKLL